MGYSACGGGTITFAKGTPDEVILNAKRKFLDIFWEAYAAGTDLEVCLCDRYREEDLYEILEEILPDVTGIDMQFEGEDDASWRIELHDGKIQEINGRTVFFMGDIFPPNDLDMMRKALEKEPQSDRRDRLIRKMDPDWQLF